MIFKRKKDKPEETKVDNEFIRSFMPHTPELAVKAYLFGLMLAETDDTETDLADALGVSENDLRAAFFYLESEGLVETVPGEEEIAVFKKPGASALKNANAKYSELIKEIQTVLGTRVMSGSELAKIYDWIEVFGFENGAAVEIVKHCLDKKGPKTQISYMDKVARSIAGKGAFSRAAVIDAFKAEELTESGAAAILKRWHLRRPPTEDEIGLYEKWTKGWKLDADAIEYALSKMTSAEKPSFAYLDRVAGELYKNGSIDGDRVREMQRQDDMINDLARLALKRAGIKTAPDHEKREQFREWSVAWCMSAELIFLAADLSKSNARPYAEMKSLLSGWHDEGISSVNAARESYEKRDLPERRSKKNNRALNYIHGETYTKEKLKELGVSFGEELYGDDENNW
ncbi:MAG: DnaD domain protein [Clostridiales bacterium]|nr:DnaD domain protein [Clostridiales bacterium]